MVRLGASLMIVFLPLSEINRLDRELEKLEERAYEMRRRSVS